MHAIILAGGKGARMAKDYSIPKQLLLLNGKPIIEHTLDALPDEVSEVVLVVGGPHEASLRAYFKCGEYNGRKIVFVRQNEPLGLAHAFRTAQGHVHGRWLGMVGDDIFHADDLAKLLLHDTSVLAAQVNDPSRFGVLVADESGYLVRAIEKPKEFISDFVWTGAMLMDERFFKIETVPSFRGEYETPDVWTKLIDTHGARIKIVPATRWFPINDKQQFEEAQNLFDKEY